MEMLGRIAYRNLLYHRQRSFATALTIAVGLTAYLLLDSMVAGLANSSIDNLQRYETASGYIYQRNYWQEREFLPLEQSLNQAAELLPQLQQLKKFPLQAAGQITFNATLIFRKQDGFPSNGSVPTRLRALAHDQQLFPLAAAVKQGRWFKLGAAELVLGSWLAEDLGAKLGSSLLLLTKDRDGLAVSQRLSVVGLLESENSVVNRSGAFLSLEFADLLLAMEGAVSEIVVQFPNSKEALISKQLKQLLPAELDFYSWRQMAADMLAVMSLKSSSSGILLSLLLLIVVISIWNTMSLAVYQRRRQLAMCRTLGFSQGQIQTLVLLESTLMAMAGTVLGFIITLPLNYLMVNFGLDYTEMLKNAESGYRLVGVIYGEWRLLPWLSAPLGALLIALLATILPARQANRGNLVKLLSQQ